MMSVAIAAAVVLGVCRGGGKGGGCDWDRNRGGEKLGGEASHDFT
jgi:hypothetical protein